MSNSGDFYLKKILAARQLYAVFQPIVGLDKGDIRGYEGLIRGPSDGPLYSPLELFKVAGESGLTLEVERLCCSIILKRFAQLNLPGKLFLNVSPGALETTHYKPDDIFSFLDGIGVASDKVVFELTEQLHGGGDYQALREIVSRYRGLSFQIAIDDLGEGFSSLRRWSELLPEYVKIDMHFIRDVDSNIVKQQFVRSLNAIAGVAGTTIIAEGIETENEFRFLSECGVACGQGFYIAHPRSNPDAALHIASRKSTGPAQSAPRHKNRYPARQGRRAQRLLRSVPVIAPALSNNDVCDLFAMHPELHTLPVVEHGKPLGVITRSALIDRFARPYQRELYGKKACSMFMDEKPLVADKDTSLQQLSHILVEADRHRLVSDFIITENGHYLGIGTSHDLLRELTDMQIDAARYANPLTQLPGNVPINQHIDYLLQSECHFRVCYADLDNFKPFNDVFGYNRGDDVIQMTGDILSSFTDAEHDFVGHIGGDDFLLVFQTADWEHRCREMLREFSNAMLEYFGANHEAAPGYVAKSRSGKKQFYSLPTLSLGVIEVEPLRFESHYQIAAAAALAKTQAKKTKGNSLFIERRRPRAMHSFSG
ncbi:EAL domain-containing protein [Eoetvoesiella caeni]